MCMFDPESSSVAAVISNLLVNAGMWDVLSQILGGPHSLTSAAAETYSSSSSMYARTPRLLRATYWNQLLRHTLTGMKPQAAEIN